MSETPLSLMHPIIRTIHEKYSSTKIRTAQQFYFGGILPTDISETLDMDMEDLGYLCFGIDRTGRSPDTWHHQMLERPADSITTYTSVKPLLLKKSEMNLMKLINDSTEEMVEKDEKLDMDDMSKAVGMIEKMDKIGRLEEGKATENIEISAGFSLRDIANGKQIEEPPTPSPQEVDESDIEDAEYNPLN